MNIFGKIKQLINKDLMAFIMTKNDEITIPEIPYNELVPDIVFKAGWHDSGKNNWAVCKTSSAIEKEDENVSIKITEISTPTIKSDEKKIKVFFVEDLSAYQHILKALIDKSEEMELTDWAKDGVEALEKIKNMKSYPDVILMDISMPRMNGIDTTRELLKITSLKIIMLTAMGGKEDVIAAFSAGAMGYLRKDAPLSFVKEAIIEVAKGGSPPMQDEIAAYLLEGTQTFTSEEKKEENEETGVKSSDSSELAKQAMMNLRKSKKTDKS